MRKDHVHPFSFFRYIYSKNIFPRYM